MDLPQHKIFLDYEKDMKEGDDATYYVLGYKFRDTFEQIIINPHLLGLAEHRNIEEWDERPFDKVPSVNVSEARRAANPIELYSRFISEELRYHVILSPCPHILMSSCHHVIVTYFTY